MEKKIYLSDDIAERLIKMGGPFPNAEEATYVLRYFLRSNFIRIYGKDPVIANDKSDEVEITTVKGRIILTSLFDPDELVISRSKNMISGNKKGSDERFFISMPAHNQLSNELYYDVTDSTMSVQECNVDFDNSEFQYKEGNYTMTEVNIPKIEYHYIGTLKPINAKYHGSEIFELTQQYPKVERPSSLIMRFIDGIKNNNLVLIPTPDDVENPFQFCEVVYTRLHEEANKVSLANNPDAAKLTKKSME